MNNISSIKEDVKDICLELEDMGYDIHVMDLSIGKDVGKDESSPIYIIQISKKLDQETLAFVGSSEYLTSPFFFYYSDIEEVVERVKDYLGDKFICIDYPGIADGGDIFNKPLNFLEIYFKI